MNTSIFVRRCAAFVLVAALPLSLAACTPADQAASSAEQTSTTDAESAPEVDRSGSGNFPEVSGDFGQEPKISAGTGVEPAVVSVKTLIKGAGKTVGADDTVLVNYTGALWDGTVFDSSFPRGQANSFSLNQVVKGWKYGLAEQKVGDRVEIVIPAQWGYGEAGSGSIPGGATLVFVVDILGALDPQDDSAVQGARLVGAAVPEGISIEGELGEEPAVSVAANAQISESQIILLAEGAGVKIQSGDTVAVRSVAALQGVTETEKQPLSGWGVAQTAPADDLELVGYTAGSRILVLRPAQSEGGQAIAFVADILGVLSDETKK